MNRHTPHTTQHARACDVACEHGSGVRERTPPTLDKMKRDEAEKQGGKSVNPFTGLRVNDGEVTKGLVHIYFSDPEPGKDDR